MCEWNSQYEMSLCKLHALLEGIPTLVRSSGAVAPGDLKSQGSSSSQRAPPPKCGCYIYPHKVLFC